jgi:hypothetical protein
MSKITLNADLVSRLPTLQKKTTIVDEKGKPIGVFMPIPASKLQPQISDEEILRRIHSGEKGFTTAELLASLENANVSSRLETKRSA